MQLLVTVKLSNKYMSKTKIIQQVGLVFVEIKHI